MDRLKQIIVLADFSEASDHAVHQAMRMSEWNEAVLHVLHVIDEIEATEAIELYAARSASDVRLMMCERVRDRLMAHLPVASNGQTTLPDERIALDVTIGDPFVDVLHAVDDLSADLLVVGHDQVNGADVVGHMVRRFARKASTKVMLVRPGELAAFQRVVACVDFSEMSPMVVEQAVRVAQQEDADLHIIHVPTPIGKLTDLLDLSGEVVRERRAAHGHQIDVMMARLMKPLEDRLSKLRVSQRILTEDDPLKGIKSYLESSDRTLAVVGSRGRKNIKGILMGSTAERLVDAAPSSLLLIKPAGFRYDVG